MLKSRSTGDEDDGTPKNSLANFANTGNFLSFSFQNVRGLTCLNLLLRLGYYAAAALGTKMVWYTLYPKAF